MQRRLGSHLLPLATLMVMSGCGGSAAPAGAPAPSTSTPAAPSASSSTAPPAAPESEPAEPPPPLLDPATLKVGAPPRIPYAFGTDVGFYEGDWRLYRPDGTSHPLNEELAGSLAVFDDFVVNAYSTEGGVFVDTTDREGRLVRPRDVAGGFGLASTPDRRVVAWVQEDRSMAFVTDQGPGIVEMAVSVPRTRTFQPYALRGRCAGDRVDPARCSVLFNTVPSRGAYRMTAAGDMQRLPLLAVADVSRDGRLVGRLTTRREGNCSGQLTRRGLVSWQVCGLQLGDFAPDGRHVLAVHGNLYSGHSHGVDEVALLDRQGETTTAWSWAESPRWRNIEQLVWEDDEHVLAVATWHGHWALVRLGVDGSAELALPPVRSSPDYSPYHLPLR